MTIEFRCPNCNQQLRVPAESVGKNARCPKCQAIVPVPDGSQPAAPAAPFGSPPAAPFGAPSSPPPVPPSPFGASSTPPANPFAAAPGAPQGAFGPPPAKPTNPFATQAPLNPYASPATLEQPLPIQQGPVGHQVVELDPILNYAMQVWKANLGLLVGVTATFLALSWVVGFGFGIMQEVMKANGVDINLVVLAGLAGNLIAQVVQIFLGIGQTQIMLNLARQRPAQYSDLFNGGSRFWPALGVSIIGGLAITVGFLLCIVPGIILLLVYWPCYYLVVDNRCKVMESFEIAGRITQGNRLTTFVVWLLSVGATILGFLALCVGILFALPFISLLWATAYLMMSGQLPVQPNLPKQFV